MYRLVLFLSHYSCHTHYSFHSCCYSTIYTSCGKRGCTRASSFTIASKKLASGQIPLCRGLALPDNRYCCACAPLMHGLKSTLKCCRDWPMTQCLHPPATEMLSAWRHDFHRHPETAFAEHRTSARLVELLKALPNLDRKSVV